MENIKELLESKAYDFLRTNEHLKDKILFLCLGGSHAYGTNIETSDIDIRGVALDTAYDILGVTNFEQFIDKETDTCIYSLSKFIKLVSNCNPNVVEMLFCKPEHYFYVTPLGQKLLDNRHLFLTKRAFHTFGGYAHAQLNRLENALCSNGEILSQEETENHINRSVTNCYKCFDTRYDVPENAIKTYVDQLAEGEEFQILIDINLKRFPLKNMRSMIEEMTNILREYEKNVGRRNAKKDDLHLNKHMMHLIRLYFMCNEILKDSTLHTYREHEHDLLIDIRNGKYRTEDGKVKLEFYELLNKLEEDSKKYYETSTLPKYPDKDKIAEFLYDSYSEYVFNR